ncbi:MAG: DUF3179 domain-containing protein [bacterium]|nr:DUF3179 domain-containing protein [bacterium]
MVHRREIAGDEIVLGNQGALWRGALTFFDHGTKSVWSQPLGLAIRGPLRGSELEQLPASLMTWSDWIAIHPLSLALDAPAQPGGLDMDELLIVVRLGDETAAYALSDIGKAGVINATLGGHNIAVVSQGGDRPAWAVYSRQTGNGAVTLDLVGTHLVDVETGAQWNAVGGTPTDSSPDSPALLALPSVPVQTDDLRRLWPQARLYDAT